MVEGNLQIMNQYHNLVRHRRTYDMTPWTGAIKIMYYITISGSIRNRKETSKIFIYSHN